MNDFLSLKNVDAGSDRFVPGRTCAERLSATHAFSEAFVMDALQLAEAFMTWTLQFRCRAAVRIDVKAVDANGRATAPLR